MFDHGNLRITPPNANFLNGGGEYFLNKAFFSLGGGSQVGWGPPLQIAIFWGHEIFQAPEPFRRFQRLCVYGGSSSKVRPECLGFGEPKARKTSKAPSGTEFSYEVFVCMDGNFLFFVFNLQSSRKKADERSLNDTFVFSIDLIAQK